MQLGGRGVLPLGCRSIRTKRRSEVTGEGPRWLMSARQQSLVLILLLLASCWLRVGRRGSGSRLGSCCPAGLWLDLLLDTLVTGSHD